MNYEHTIHSILDTLTEATISCTPPTDVRVSEPRNRFASWMSKYRLITVSLTQIGFTPASLTKRANANSRVIVRDQITKEQYAEILQAPVFSYRDISGSRNFEVADFEHLYVCGPNFAVHEISYLIERLIRRQSQMIYWIQ